MLRERAAVLTTDCRTLAELANPFHPPEDLSVPNAESERDCLLRLADINRVLLSLYKNLQRHKESVPVPFWKSLDHQARLRNSVRAIFDDELSRIALLLREQGIRWMLIKTVRSFPREIRDIDILIFDNFRPLQNALAQLGYSKSDKISGHKMGLRAYRKLENATKVPVSIDVHSRLGYEGLTFANEEELWSSRQAWSCNGETLAIPSIEHQLLTMILNSFFGDGGLRLSDIFEAKSLLDRGAKFSDVHRIASSYGWAGSAETVLSLVNSAFQSLGLTESLSPQSGQVFPANFPSYFRIRSLGSGLLEKALHDLGVGGNEFLSSWGRLGMKYVSSMSRDRLLRDSWNEIFQR